MHFFFVLLSQALFLMHLNRSIRFREPAAKLSVQPSRSEAVNARFQSEPRALNRQRGGTVPRSAP